MSASAKKHFNYFEYFYISTHYARTAAKFLEDVINNYDPETISEKLPEMHNIENNADLERHKMLAILTHEFMTPIEMEDIVALAQTLDEVVDTIEDVLQGIYMYNIREMRPEAKEFCGLIVKCASALADVMTDFEHFRTSKTLNRSMIAVNEIESEGDALFLSSMRSLHVGSDDTRDVVAWTKMFELMENCLDNCENAVDIVEGILMKNT